MYLRNFLREIVSFQVRFKLSETAYVPGATRYLASLRNPHAAIKLMKIESFKKSSNRGKVVFNCPTIVPDLSAKCHSKRTNRVLID